MPRPVLTALAASLLLAPLAAQEAPQFHGRTDLVSVFATVTDPQGHLVPDLKESDFQIFDDGKRQTVTQFSAEVQPVTVVLMLDRSGSVAPEADWVREA